MTEKPCEFGRPYVRNAHDLGGLGFKDISTTVFSNPQERIEQQFMIIYGFYFSIFVGGYYTYDGFFWNPSQI